MTVVPLHHADLGGAGRPPLVVLHGLLGSSRNWQTAGRDLAARFHVLAPDARNHGRSPHADGMSVDAMVADTLAWMDGLGVARATVVGLSMGGRTAMALACRHPERMERLVVVDVAPRAYSWRGHQEEFAAMNELDVGRLRSRQEAELRLEARVPDLGMRRFITTNLAPDPAGGFRWTVNLPALAAALPLLEAEVPGPGERFDGPTLFIVGGRSRYVTTDDHALIRERFPAARITVLPGSGHNPHMDAREEFVRAALAE